VPGQDGKIACPTSVAVSPTDQLLFIVSDAGNVESYDIQAGKTRKVNYIADQWFLKITVDPNNQFVLIASASGNLYKYDTG
jgi:WD40 repeat protein